MNPARARPAVRPPGLPVRRSRIRRASAGLSPVRAGAAFVLLLSALGIYGVGASSAFAYRQLDFESGPASYTSREVVLATLGLDAASPNLFLLRTDALAQRLLSLPAVTGASVSV